MKRYVIALMLMLCMGASPVFADASSRAPAAESVEEPFFTSSEADALTGNKEGMHPVVWVFAAGGVGALAVIAVIIRMGKQQ